VVNNNSNNHNNKIIFNLIYKINNNQISLQIHNNLQIIRIIIQMHKANQLKATLCFIKINSLNNNSNII